MIGGVLRGKKRAVMVPSLAFCFFGSLQRCNVMNSKAFWPFDTLISGLAHATAVRLLPRPQDIMMASEAPDPA
jgi:hypothetical protein